MMTEKLECHIKTRVPEPIKSALETVAVERHLDLSDIAREAFREYLEKRGMPNGIANPQLALPIGKDNGQ